MTLSRPAHFTTTPRGGLHSEHFPKPVASYSQGFQVGQMVFITGQPPVDPATGDKVGGGDISLGTRQTLRNFMAVPEAAGCTASDVVSAVIDLTDIDTLVSALVLGIQLEISGFAVKDQP